MPGNIELLPRESLVTTSEVDHADWNYSSLLGFLQRTRFRLVRSLIRGRIGGDLLEIGYGSGIFFPELQKYCDHISGIDIHPFDREVMESIRDLSIEADLRSGDVCHMPFGDASFDTAVVVSALEYVEDIDTACREIVRVLKPDGVLIAVTPGKSQILDTALKLFGGEDAYRNYGDRRERLVPALSRHFDTEKLIHWPWPGMPAITAYRALRLRPKLPA